MIVTPEFLSAFQMQEAGFRHFSNPKANVRQAFRAYSGFPHGCCRRAQKKVIYPDLCIAEIVVWQFLHTTPERPHGYKYRINDCTADGTAVVRYENETGNGNNKHIGALDPPYEFESLDILF